VRDRQVGQLASFFFNFFSFRTDPGLDFSTGALFPQFLFASSTEAFGIPPLPAALPPWRGGFSRVSRCFLVEAHHYCAVQQSSLSVDLL